MPTGNREHDTMIKRIWRQNNPEKTYLYVRTEKQKQYQRDYKKRWASIPEHKERLKLANKLWRLRNPEFMKKLSGARRKRHVEFINRLKMKPCSDCGVQYNPWMMDFDHRDPKIKSFGISKNMVSFKRVEEEIKKCDVVCANCHRDRTHRQWEKGVLR